MISVVIPTYKQPDALDLCLKSAIYGQTNRNQIIVVIDGFIDINKHIVDKYKDQIDLIILEKNYGTCKATNIGTYYTQYDKILIVNDDNVFPKYWDSYLENDFRPDAVITPNEIEPYKSIFPQKHIKNLGRDPRSFDLLSFWEYSESISRSSIENNGSTFPILISKINYMKVGGFDENYPSLAGHVSDWDFFLKCQLSGMRMLRTYKCHFYHFVSLSAQSEEMKHQSQQNEQNCHEYGRFKWGSYIRHNFRDNSKYI